MVIFHSYVSLPEGKWSGWVKCVFQVMRSWLIDIHLSSRKWLTSVIDILYFQQLACLECKCSTAVHMTSYDQPLHMLEKTTKHVCHRQNMADRSYLHINFCLSICCCPQIIEPEIQCFVVWWCSQFVMAINWSIDHPQVWDKAQSHADCKKVRLVWT